MKETRNRKSANISTRPLARSARIQTRATRNYEKIEYLRREKVALQENFNIKTNVDAHFRRKFEKKANKKMTRK